MEATPKQTCSPELQRAFLDMLTATLITIRNNPTDARLCEALADHLHNIPNLLADFHVELLAYYWEVERPGFLKALRTMKRTAEFDQPWQVIEREYHRFCR
jgi:hypothetical protein